jgi:hypothetical protein
VINSINFRPFCPGLTKLNKTSIIQQNFERGGNMKIRAIFLSLVFFAPVGAVTAQSGIEPVLKVIGDPNAEISKIVTSLGDDTVVEISLIGGKSMPVKLIGNKPGELSYLVYDEYYMSVMFGGRKLNGVQVFNRRTRSAIGKVQFQKPFEPVQGKQYSLRIDAKRLSHELIFDFEVDASGNMFVPR